MSKEAIQSCLWHVRPINSETCALILIDHQVGTLQFVHTMSPWALSGMPSRFGMILGQGVGNLYL